MLTFYKSESDEEEDDVSEVKTHKHQTGHFPLELEFLTKRDAALQQGRGTGRTWCDASGWMVPPVGIDDWPVCISAAFVRGHGVLLEFLVRW